MIQRVQSLYLLLAAAFVGVFLSVGDVWRTVVAVIYPWAAPVTLLLGALVVVAALVAVFLYKDRARQRQVVFAAQLLDLALVLVLVVVMVLINSGDHPAWADAAQTAYLTALLPLGAYIFLRLARRGVEKDIALVRSMDRLR
jgi:phosphoglycerol transferase MdoB-like AlkP superfamily enzyme